MHGDGGRGVQGRQAGRQGLSEENLEKMGKVAWSAFTWEVLRLKNVVFRPTLIPTWISELSGHWECVEHTVCLCGA